MWHYYKMIIMIIYFYIVVDYLDKNIKRKQNTRDIAHFKMC